MARYRNQHIYRCHEHQHIGTWAFQTYYGGRALSDEENPHFPTLAEAATAIDQYHAKNADRLLA